MPITTVVEATCRALGPVGVLLLVSHTGAPSADLQREAVPGCQARLSHCVDQRIRRRQGRPRSASLAARTIMVPTEFAAQARKLLGPDKLLVVGPAVVADAAPHQAKATDDHVANRVATTNRGHRDERSRNV
jgi:hypothetical protein